MITIGIDPGRTGAWVSLDDDAQLHAWGDMPAIGQGGIDWPLLARALGRIARPATVVIEWQQVVPIFRLDPKTGQRVAVPGGSKSAFVKGEYYGGLCALCAALGLPYEPVKPAVWQRAMLPRTKASTKDRAALLASQRVPQLPIRGPRGALKDGRADACCLALYGVEKRKRGL